MRESTPDNPVGRPGGTVWPQAPTAHNPRQTSKVTHWQRQAGHTSGQRHPQAAAAAATAPARQAAHAPQLAVTLAAASGVAIHLVLRVMCAQMAGGSFSGPLSFTRSERMESAR